MKSQRTSRQVAVALLLFVAFLLQETWALAGTTGGINGTVMDETGAPVVGATIKVVSASQSASSSTDASGHFNFLSLAPDTYTVSIEKPSYSPASYAGITVFADNQLALRFTLNKQLKTIASVTSRSTGSLVKSSVGGDLYSVNSSSIQSAAVLGGGGNLNSAYSAIASVPGVTAQIGTAGWNQNTYVRGSQTYFTGFEFDGVPVNRAFDNYNASTESNLGLAELQLYTGGGPASITSSGTSGFINQVIKTGTYPGYMSLSGGLATDAFYHQAKVEAGGATPDRRFSYYVGLSGYSQAFRFLDNSNGVSLMGPGGIYALNSYSTTAFGFAALEGAYPICDPSNGSQLASTVVGAGSTAGCLYPYSGLAATGSNVIDREDVVNFHFAVPRKDGRRDDLQLLWNASMLKTYTYGDINDLGGVTNWSYAATGGPNYTPVYRDATVIPTAFGTPVTAGQTQPYLFPDSPAHTLYKGALPANQQDGTYNDQGIVKLQYTHQMGDKAFARLLGYTFFSDWNQSAPYSALGNYIYGFPAEGFAANYLLNTHTTGGEFQIVDQLTDKHLLQFTTNYTKANVLRWNNTGFLSGNGNPIGILGNSGGAFAGPYSCWSSTSPVTDSTTGTVYGPDSQIPCYLAPLSNAKKIGYLGQPIPVVGPNAASAAANTVNLWNGYESGSYNKVAPKFLNGSLSDQIRASDRLLLNVGLRYDNYVYGLPNAADTADKFYASQVANYICYDTNPNNPNPVFTNPLVPGQNPPANAVLTADDCNHYVNKQLGLLGSPNAVTTYVHPNGTTQDGTAAPTFSTNMPNSYTLNYWSVRASGTYTQSPDTVWRASAGRFIQPPISASVQYLNKSGNNVALWANFMDLGFFSPFHQVPAQTSAQYDVSLERHIRGTDVNFKLTPFYNFTNGYQEQSFIGAGFVTQVPVGNFRSTGVEAAITKGDFSKNGLSGSLALTYTKAQVNYQGGRVNGNGQNQISILNQAINDYNFLTTSSPCYTPAGATAGTPVACGPGTIANPYYGKPKQSLLDPNGWYAPTGNVLLPGVNTNPGFYDAPWVGNIIVNYRKDKFAITPSIQWATGSSYGSPLTVQGVDPRECAGNDPTPGFTSQCDWQSLQGAGATATGLLYIPNPQTGTFDSIGQYHNPVLLTGNVALTYDASPKISLNLTLANVFHTCFGGSKEPWTTAYSPGTNICSYVPNGSYVSNFQRGAGMANPRSYDAAANGTMLFAWQQQSYAPLNGTNVGLVPPPFNAYLTVNIKI